MSKSNYSRRSFLQVMGLAGGGLLLEQTALGSSRAEAQTADPKFLVMAYFGGGWDQLLALDPRDQRQAQYKFSASGANPTSGIYPAYEENADADPIIRSIMNTATGTLGAGSGVQRLSTAPNVTFGPAVHAELVKHAADIALVRGVSMDTLTHEVGRRYFLTGKFPRGLVASGSSLNTVVTGQSPVFAQALDLPNLVLNTETYNETFGAYASGVQARGASDVLSVLLPQTQSPVLGARSESALEAFELSSDSCEAHGYDVDDLVQAFRGSQIQARRMTNGAKASAFSFPTTPTAQPIIDLYNAFGIRPGTTAGSYNTTDLAGPKGRAAVAGQALTQGLSQVVSVQMAGGLDDHNDLFGQQSVEQRSGWEALGRLMSYLKTKEYRPGKSYYDLTTFVAFSEFSRTPMINVRDGRDHHLTNSCLIAGPGLKGNMVFGASSDTGQNAQKFNTTTGVLDTGSTGKIIKPSDIHATLLQSMGLSFSHLTNQGAKVLTPLLG